MEGCPLLLPSTLVLSSLSPYWLSVIINRYLLQVALIEHVEWQDHHNNNNKNEERSRKEEGQIMIRRKKSDALVEGKVKGCQVYN